MPDCQPAGSHFVDGRLVDDPAGEPIPVVYPATGETIATLRAATPAVVEAALASAARAQRDWAALRPVERGRVLRRAADLLRERNRELSVLETYDTGKPLSETLVADAWSAADALEWFGGIAADLGGGQVSLGGDWGYTIREPLGVCVGIGAWNYPTQIAAWKGAPALACGNAMVFKPSETTPLGALRLAAILVEAGAPPGLYNVVQGRGDVGGALIADPRVAKVSITGSVPTGRRVYEAAARGLKHVTLELGGKSPLVVFEDADLDAAVSGAIMANFYSTGQVCSNGTRVFVHRAIREAFLARLVERLGGVAIGDPQDEATTFGPMATARQREIVEGFIARGREEGARLVHGGGRPAVTGFEGGFWLEPTVFAEVTDGMAIATDEIFGPVMAVLDFDSEEEVLRRANATPFGLAAGVFTRDLARGHRMAAGFQAGTTFINAYNLTPVELPFGGAKGSGIGRENGRAAIEHYSQLKSVYVGMSPPQAPF